MRRQSRASIQELFRKMESPGSEAILGRPRDSSRLHGEIHDAGQLPQTASPEPEGNGKSSRLIDLLQHTRWTHVVPAGFSYLEKNAPFGLRRISGFYGLA